MLAVVYLIFNEGYGGDGGLAGEAVRLGGALADSARADFLRRLGRPVEARAAYQRAFELTESAPERRFLARRFAELGCAEQA